jgi:hypothetical protein
MDLRAHCDVTSTEQTGNRSNATLAGYTAYPSVEGRAGVLLALVANLVLSSTGLALVYDPNDGAARAYTGTGVASGSYALVDLQTAAVQTGDTIVHPMQLNSNSSEDFIGWGTAKGAGVADCPDDYSSGWKVYVDGTSFGTYFCRQAYGSLSSNAQNQALKFLRGTCSGTSKWVFYVNAVQKTCQVINGSSGSISDGSENISDSTQNLGIRYHGLQVKFASGWVSWNNNHVDVADPGYAIQNTSATDFTIYLP